MPMAKTYHQGVGEGRKEVTDCGDSIPRSRDHRSDARDPCGKPRSESLKGRDLQWLIGRLLFDRTEKGGDPRSPPHPSLAAQPAELRRASPDFVRSDFVLACPERAHLSTSEPKGAVLYSRSPVRGASASSGSTKYFMWRSSSSSSSLGCGGAGGVRRSAARHGNSNPRIQWAPDRWYRSRSCRRAGSRVQNSIASALFGFGGSYRTRIRAHRMP